MGIQGHSREEWQINSSDIKVTVIGEGGVGKTSLIRRWCEGKFNRSYVATLGVDITDKIINVDDKVFKMVMWDIAGQQLYQQYRMAFYKGTNGIIIVCDITRLESLEALPSWKKEVEKYVNRELPSVLLANKSDLMKSRKILSDEVVKVGQILVIPPDRIFETSALSGHNVEIAFNSLARQVKGV
ncbi:MAG: Rab family GTPase, partial [Candidatus Hodarchaeales archaeon]|jgi:Ras-related protein Rab-1A